MTWHALKTSSRCKASEATIARRLHEKGYWFYGMRHKPLLTEEDVQAEALVCRHRLEPFTF